MGYESEYFRLHMASKSGLVDPWGLGVIVRRGRPSWQAVVVDLQAG